MRCALSLFFSAIFSFFLYVPGYVFKQTDEKLSGSVLIVLLSEMMMLMMMPWMYVAVVIELEACVRTRAKCVSIVNRCNRILTETERRFNRIGLISDYTKMLSISIYSQAVFLFQVTYYIYQGNSKWQYRRKMKNKDRERTSQKIAFFLDYHDNFAFYF
jgi:hypothetical protein